MVLFILGGKFAVLGEVLMLQCSVITPTCLSTVRMCDYGLFRFFKEADSRIESQFSVCPVTVLYLHSRNIEEIDRHTTQNRTFEFSFGCAIAEAASRLLLTAEVRIPSQVSPRGTWGGQWHWDRLPPVLRRSPVSIIPSLLHINLCCRLGNGQWAR